MDVYFTEFESAYLEAQKQTKHGIFENLGICYYGGPKQDDEEYDNLIHLPLENIFDYFSETPNRNMTKFFSNIPDEKVKQEIQEYIKTAQVLAWNEKNKFCNMYKEEIKKLNPDFSEPLRILFITTRITTVLQYVIKNLEETFRNLGYDTFISIESNAMQSWGANDSDNNANFAWHLKNILEYNPHVIFNIDWLNNEFLNDKVFNLVWFQDPMEILENDKEINLRDRDFIFALSDVFKKQLKEKNVESELQPFCLNSRLYKKRDTIKKEKKIVYIGTSYVDRINKYKHEEDFNTIYEEVKELFEERSCLRDLKDKDGEMAYLMKKHNKDVHYFGDIYAYLSRDYCVEKLCSIETDYEIEIYGYGFEGNEIIQPYHKGPVSNGEELSKIYNSATYGFCPGAYIFMQRTLECAFSETIPLVLDVRPDKPDGDYDKRVEKGIEFFHINNLEKLLQKEPRKDMDYSFLKSHFDYTDFAKRCIDKVTKEVKKSEN